MVFLPACTGPGPGFETPTVTVKSVRALPSTGALTYFEIVLHIINPDREAQELAGVDCTVSIQCHDIVKGVGHDVPVRYR